MSVEVISAKDFLKVNAHKESCVIDLRTPIEVASESLPKFIHLPVQDFNFERLEQALRVSNQINHNIYLLCQSGKRADIAVAKLPKDLDLNVFIIEGGLSALKEQGILTVQSDRKIISLERQVRIAAGALTLVGSFLALFININFLAIPIFVGSGLMFAGITNTCGMGLLLAKMPWNKS